MNVQSYNNVLADLAITTQRQTVTGLNIIFDLRGVLFDSNDGKDYQPCGAARALKPVDYSKALRLLNDCIKQGHRLFGISNWTRQSYDFLLSDPRTAQIFEKFEDIILADCVGIKKPDPRIFAHLIEKHRLDPFRCIFIDDQKINLQAAEQAGIIKGILCKDLNLCQVRQDLQLHGAL